MKKKEMKKLVELSKNPNGGIIGTLKNRSEISTYNVGSITNKDIADLLEQLKKEKPNVHYH